jgi:Cys-tRNA synthase (O-phospho-L-seryl-tRNA:Cys-tRNA synthase)
MGLSDFVWLQVSNKELSELINDQLQHGEGQNRHSKVHENVVSGPEGNVEGLEVGCNQNKHNLGRHGEEHEGVTQPLCEEGQLSGLAHKAVEELGDDYSIEICALSILDTLSCVAGRLVGERRNLLDIAASPDKCRCVDGKTVDKLALNSCHSKINGGMLSVDPIHHRVRVCTGSQAELCVSKSF